MSTKPSHVRKCASQADVRLRVEYAASSGDHANPFPSDDRRHPRFTRELHRALGMAWLFEDLCTAHGQDQATTFQRRGLAKPGPVIPYELLAS